MRRVIFTVLLVLFSLPAQAQLDEVEARIVMIVDKQFDEAVSVLAKSVDIESSTENFEGF